MTDSTSNSAQDSLSISSVLNISDTSIRLNSNAAIIPEMSLKPVDNAFIHSKLEIATEPDSSIWTNDNRTLAGDITAAISLLIILALFKKIINIVPTLFACVLRWKENINLEDSVRMSWDRNVIALAMIIPFCLIVEHFGLYSPEYMTNLEESARLAITTGTFVVYFVFRALAWIICKPSKTSKEAYQTGYRASWTFFIILTLLLLIVTGVTNFTNSDISTVKTVMFWLSGVVYFILLIREIQIFTSSCSLFTAFLYLCALEIVPTGLLVGSVYVF